MSDFEQGSDSPKPAGGGQRKLPMAAVDLSSRVAQLRKHPEPPERFAHLVRKHPCLTEEAHGKYGRLHLPISPVCNIQCRFCRRSFDKLEQRPGVTRSLVAPEDAVATVERALTLCPDITVVGIAGPGDSLCTPHARQALKAVLQRFPQLIPCLSTNGLALADHVDELIDIGVHAVTVTVNAVDPTVLSGIVSSIRHEGRTLRGKRAAEILIDAQRKGITRAAEKGAFVKINTVVIPGVNLDHVETVARTVTEWGAQRINLIPLIPQHEFVNHSAPSCTELAEVREAAERYLPVFRHCRQCRADACGVPGKGEDLGSALYENQEPVPATFSHG